MAQIALSGHRILWHCSDDYCCENCEVYRSVTMFDGRCLWDESFELYEKEECSSTTGGYVYLRGHWDTVRCQGKPIYSVRTGECYHDYQSGGSYYFGCVRNLFLKSKQEMITNHDESTYSIIGGAVVIFVFLIGILCGYRFYTKRKPYA